MRHLDEQVVFGNEHVTIIDRHPERLYDGKPGAGTVLLPEPGVMPSASGSCGAAIAGTKHDTGKVGMDLLPYDALAEIAKVLDFGANKYSPGNWANGIEVSRLIAALERHIGEFKEGRDIDPESGLNHMAHAGCNILFILWMLKHRPDLDNRWIKEVATNKQKKEIS